MNRGLAQLPLQPWLAEPVTPVKVQGFCGPPSPCSAFGRPFGYLKDARDQNQRVPDEEQTFTGWLSVITVATGYTVPPAQLGLQSSSLMVPVPTASETDQTLHVILARNAVESPESWQPNSETQAGWYSPGPLTSWPGARSVVAAVCEAVTLGEADGVAAGADVAAADEAGALEAGELGEPAEVADAGALAGLEAAADELEEELQAVTSKAAPASTAAAVT